MKLYHVLQGKIISDPMDGNYFDLKTEDGTQYEIYTQNRIFYERLDFCYEDAPVYVLAHGDLSESALDGLDIWPDTEVR